MPRLPEPDLEHVLTQTDRAVWEALRGSRLFITGGSGFVGTWLVRSFLYTTKKLALNSRAVLLTRDAARFRAKAPDIGEHPAIEFLEGDARSFTFPDGAFEFVIHAATEPAFAPTREEPAGTLLRDIESTRRLLEFAGLRKTGRFLFTSSGAVYGKQPAGMGHIPEDYLGAPSVLDGAAVYGHAKRISELLCSMYGSAGGMGVAIARLFAFAGPELPLDSNFAVGNFVRDALAGGPIRVAGDGTPFRSYLYAADLCVWLWTMLVRAPAGRPYNVGSGEEISIRDLAELVAECRGNGCRVEIAKKPEPGVLPPRYVPSVERALVELGLRPVIPLREGLRRMLAWYEDDTHERSGSAFSSP
jgi:dTDP-glucose 4,6-dehydratase